MSAPAFEERVGRAAGALHGSVGTVRLAAGDQLDAHLHSFEELVYVLAGAPLLALEEGCFALAPNQAVRLGPGEAHAWSNPGTEAASWIELQAPPARPPGAPPDTVTVDDLAVAAAEPVDPADPRRQRFGRWREDGSDSPLLALPGITASMVIDERQGAVQARTFMIDFAAGTKLAAHDHPFEETFYVLEGECEWHVGEKTIRAMPGTYLFIPPGVPHNIANVSKTPARVLMTVSPPGHEHYFEELAKLAARGVPDPKELADLRARCDTDQLSTLTTRA